MRQLPPEIVERLGRHPFGRRTGYLIVDSTIVRAHKHATGKKGGLKIAPLAEAVAD